MIQFCDEQLVSFRGGTSDVYKKRLVRRTGEGAEEVEKVLFASRAGGYDGLGALEVGAEGIEL